MNTAVLILRAKQLGLTFSELEQMTVGFLIDLIVEGNNDEFKYTQKATQDDFRKF